ncbi:MAG: carboxymuconolactone decarboxylase family protein [Cellvibrionales bacterium]|nr:carboxymuconolactone decarboxylase family protein [Cellvibrionales bacterium]
MARIPLPEGDLPERYRVFGLHPALGKALAGLSEAIYEKSNLDKRVREAVRMRIALINECQICLGYRFPELQALGIDEAFYEAVRDWRSSDRFSEKEKMAIRSNCGASGQWTFTASLASGAALRLACIGSVTCFICPDHPVIPASKP